MLDVRVQLFLVALKLESGAPSMVTLTNRHNAVPSRPARGNVVEVARGLLARLWDELAVPLTRTGPAAGEVWEKLKPKDPVLAGAFHEGTGVNLVFTCALPCPMAERPLDVARNTKLGWRTLNQSVGRRDKPSWPTVLGGSEAVVLDHWRQALEETDVALDLLPPYLTLLQLRGIYDAVWGYDQDPSGFKRWAVDRPGAFQALLTEHPAGDHDPAFYRSLAEVLPAEIAVEAAAAAQGAIRGPVFNDLAPAIALAAATTANRLFPRPGPEPTWYGRSAAWRAGPSWIENLYPPRPAWTRWEVDTA
jgi:hypothetical protein